MQAQFIVAPHLHTSSQHASLLLLLPLYALQPPFNDAARKMAGFGPEWYMPLAAEGAAAAAAKAAKSKAEAAKEQ
jgi:hypothetical protein